MDKVKEKLTFSKIEILFMVVMVSLVIIAGTAVFTITTKNRNIANFKKDASSIISTAKNTYAAFMMSNKTKGIVKSDSGEYQGMCITIKGLKENGYLVKEYKDWEGYVVIEETEDKDYHYSIWATNKKYVIDGYDSTKIDSLTIDNGITSYNDDSFTSKVKTSFTGTSGDKGGTGSSDGSNLQRYQTSCINEKVE